MKKYIALLRGINVGGKNKVPMVELKMIFEAIGFINVITYINSGNVIFSTVIEDEEKVRIVCENALIDKFKFSIPIVIISPLTLKNALENVPIWWDNDKKSKHNAIFVMPPVTAREVIEKIGDIKPLYEQIYCYDNIIFWSAPIMSFSKTKWSKVSSTSLYNCLTIRNANTTKKLLQIINI